MSACIVCTRDGALFCYTEVTPVKKSMPRLYRRFHYGSYRWLNYGECCYKMTLVRVSSLCEVRI